MNHPFWYCLDSSLYLINVIIGILNQKLWFLEKTFYSITLNNEENKKRILLLNTYLH